MTAVLARIHPLSKGLFQGHLTVSNMSGRGGGPSLCPLVGRHHLPNLVHRLCTSQSPLPSFIWPLL